MAPLWKNHIWSWVSHAVGTVTVPAALMVPVKALWIDSGFWSFACYTVGVVGVALLFREKEKKDQKGYGEDFDKTQGRVTARVDKAGDLIGPYVAATTALTGLSMFGHWSVPIIPVALTLGYFVWETSRAKHSASPSALEDG